MFTDLKPIVSYVANYFPDAVFYKQTDAKVVGLTIDDVGDASTRLILEALTVSGSQPAKATFFVTTSYLNPEDNLLTEIVNQGHELGNHGVYDHTHAQLPSEVFTAEIEQAHQALTHNTNQPVRWFRPARGLYNREMLACLQEMGKNYNYYPKFILASALPLDTYPFVNQPQFTSAYLSQFIFPGAILVVHGGNQSRAQNTAQFLSWLLENLHKLGYQATSLTNLWQI